MMKTMILTMIAALALTTACSRTHHGDGSNDSTTPTPTIGWGEKLCKDHCGTGPDCSLPASSWIDIKKYDLCGLPWDCHYDCSRTCPVAP